MTLYCLASHTLNLKRKRGKVLMRSEILSYVFNKGSALECDHSCVH